MAQAPKPYLISEFKTGINTYLQPWQRPIDAFDPLQNAYIYRGVINKRSGYSQFGDVLKGRLIITNITKAASAVVTADNNFTAGDIGVTTIAFSGVVGMVEINGLTGTITAYTSTTVTVNINSTGFTAYVSGGSGVYLPSIGRSDPVMGIMQWMDQASGNTSLVVASTKNLYLYDVAMNSFNIVASPPAFTGTIRNFFNWTNWQASSGADSFLYMTNNFNNVYKFDGTTAFSLVPVVDGAGQTITKALDVKVYKQRLLLIRPTLSTDGVQNQSIYWSAIQNDALWRTDIAGQGGELAAPTGDVIISAEFIRDVLVVFFDHSTWIFRFTGNANDPFRWDKINISKATDAPYGTVAYDERCTSIGNTGLIACDGVNVQRYDIPIIDYYENEFSQRYYEQSFSQRYDNLNQAWTLYVSTDEPFPKVGNIAPGSDKALVYNFLENTWATYTWSRPLTCLGTFYNVSGTTWASLNQDPKNQWKNTDFPWDSYITQQAAPILLSGDTTGHVYRMDDGSFEDVSDAIIADIKTTRWNPIVDIGQRVQFVYIDIYYTVSDPVVFTLSFYVDNNSAPISPPKTFTLDGTGSNDANFKRVFVNLVGQFVRMEMVSDKQSSFQILGMILWATPSGRLTKP